MTGADMASGELQEWAMRAGTGDPAALTVLVKRTSALVWRVCAALVDPASADDLTQETYLRAVRSLAGYRGESAPGTWLATIARRVCAEEISHRQRERAANSRVAWGPPTDRSARSPEAVVDVRDAVRRLPAQRREALLLTAVAGLSYAEAAAVCGCPIGTIRSRVSRARASVSDMLELAGPATARHASG